MSSLQRQTCASRRSLGHGGFAFYEGRLGRHACFLCIATKDAQRHTRSLQGLHREGAPLTRLASDARMVLREALLRQSLQGNFGAGSAEEGFATRAFVKVAPVDAAFFEAFVRTLPRLSPGGSAAEPGYKLKACQPQPRFI